MAAPGRSQSSGQEVDLGDEDRLVLGLHQLVLLTPCSLLSRTLEAPRAESGPQVSTATRHPLWGKKRPFLSLDMLRGSR